VSRAPRDLLQEGVASQAATSLEADRVSPYLAFLFLLLSTATLFDGFDAAMIGFAAPEARKSLGIDLEEWGLINSVTRLGVMASFLFLFFADRIGRRGMMMFTVIGFTVAQGATALVTDKVQFTLLQLVARLFLTSEISLAIIMIGEEFPARWRGLAIAVLTSLATVGVMIMAKIQPYVLLPDGAESNWLHATGHWMVTTMRGALGFEQTAESWRALYALGLLPLVIVLVLRLAMRETRRFEATRVEQRARPKRTWRELGREALTPWRPEYRRRSAIVALLWNSVFLVTGPSVVYWVIFAREQLQLTTHQVGDIVFWGYAGGVAGHFVAGWLIDFVGRKYTCAGFYVLAAVSIFLLYHVHTLAGQYVWMIMTVFSFGAANTSTHVYASELFPTEIRATGYGWTTNLAGRVTEVVTPLAIGLLIAPLGIPGAIAVVAAGPIVGALLVLRYAPETRGMTLEQIASELQSPRASVVAAAAAEPARSGAPLQRRGP
jgi:putative MFS transporter